ncbi:hypothetical protein K7I13_01770 [Brucepastera parasyntrophica]|uniref:hypothetical protein n=1 Tax=Brucepastera parasyntrophica TaxID=2880008 RepID=UPI0021096FF4|nr:hypothetical protein [Brucepastera parasyntrophica]ULQ60082.1 hypothetical protein K7I13_01770 [Brucepastera parasyntrophica]
MNDGGLLNSKNLDEFSRFTNEGLIKSTDSPLQGLTSEQKALLNRKGNELFNQGEVESAKRIFITTGYSDGLTRVGDFYTEKDKPIDALKMYWLAHNKRKAEPIIEKLALMIESIISI